jgi:hypothetical protein
MLPRKPHANCSGHVIERRQLHLRSCKALPRTSLDDGAARDGGQAALCCVVDGARRTRLNPANRSAIADPTLDKTILKEAFAQEW